MMRVWIFLLLPLSALAVEEQVQTSYYDISGSTPGQIWQEMRARGPATPDGKRWTAYTRWDIRWRFEFDESPRGCRIGGIDVRLRIRYTMPRWEEPREASATVARQWSRFIDALEVHEEGHGDFGREAAERVEAELPRLPARRDCQAASRAANAVGDRIIEEVAADERDYDRRTNHGATQGTAFFRDLARSR
jgi:predicted secreted Zn-dependent protease